MSLEGEHLGHTEFPVNGRPYNITAGPDGNPWFTESDGNKIGRINPTGSITEFPIPAPASYPEGITAGPDGNLWFTMAVNSGGSWIGHITTGK